VAGGVIDAIIGNYRTAENRGIFVTSTAADLLVEHRLWFGPWQSSATMKVHTVSLGRSFRAIGFAMTGVASVRYINLALSESYSARVPSSCARAPARASPFCRVGKKISFATDCSSNPEIPRRVLYPSTHACRRTAPR
jgi:hypothetical protein